MACALARTRARIAPRRQATRGLVLIDALIAVVVFALGVLAVVALQGTANQQSSQAKYRAEATMLANALIAQMWLTDRQPTTLEDSFATGGDAYEAWLATVAGVLPGAEDNPPEVTVEAVPAGAAGAPDTARVTVQLRWKPPSAAAEDPPNQLVMVTQIR
jgi:type IV pilus assembly protein PilV